MNLVVRLGWALVFAVSAFPAWARLETVMDWSWDLDDDGLPYMFTVSDSGGIFGKWCDGENDTCYWLMLTRTPCEKGVTAPVLINDQTNVHVHEISCVGEKMVRGVRYWRYALTDDDRVDSTISAAERIGIAMAIEGDSFRVFRFSGRGSAVVLQRWQRAAEAASQKRKRSSTREQRL